MLDNCNYEFILLDKESGMFGKSKNFNIMNTGNYLGIYIDFRTSKVRLSDQLYGDGPAEPD